MQVSFSQYSTVHRLTCDEKGRADGYEEKVGAGTAYSYRTSFTYDREDRITELSYGLTGDDKVTYTYGGLEESRKGR